MSELKRCPFCGGEAVTAEMYNTKLKKLFPIVKCLDCECRTPMTETFEEAIKAWNVRVPIKRILERIETEYSQDVGKLKMISVDKVISIVKEESGGINGIHVHERL